MNKIIVGILVLLVLGGGGGFMATKNTDKSTDNNTSVSHGEIREQVKKDFLDYEERFLNVQKYCFENPEVASKGINDSNYKELPIADDADFILNQLNYSAIRLFVGKEGNDDYLNFTKMHDRKQEGYKLVYSTQILADNYEEIAPNWYVVWIYYT